MISDIYEPEYSEDEYQKAYNAIYTASTMFATTQSEKRAYILGGQPGAGKSTIYAGNDALNDYVTVNGDQYRKYHPRYDDIVKYDLDNYAARTQPFVNRIVEKLISDLAEQGYDMIIEGTLRNPNVPIKTCNLLKSNGYNTKLIVLACDAEQSWKSTVLRAKLMQEMGERPRLVPIDKYSNIVNDLPESLNAIDNSGCFDSISVINRNNEFLYRDGDAQSPADVLKDVLNLGNWNERFIQHAQEYMEAKIELIKKESELLHEQGYLPCAHEEVSARER